MTFYRNVGKQYWENSITKAIKTGQMTETDGELIRAYVIEYQATKHIKDHRVQKTTIDLVQWRRFIKAPYQECTITDIYQAITELDTANTLKGTPFKQNTKHDYVLALRQFLVWLIENDHSSLPIEKVRKIRIPSKDHITTSPDEILSDDEVKRIIEACQGSRERSRDRAIIATLYETGCRVGELARMQWKDLKIDQDGVKVNIRDTKTSRLRYDRILIAKDYIIQWKNDTHGSTEGDGYVFISSKGNPLEYFAIAQLLKRAAKRAGITKRVHLHLLRASRATHLLRAGVPEGIIKEKLWGNVSTTMLRTYARLSEDDIDDAMFDLYGMERKKSKKISALAPFKCPVCSAINTPTATFCTGCGAPRDLTELMMPILQSILSKEGIEKELIDLVERGTGLKKEKWKETWGGMVNRLFNDKVENQTLTPQEVIALSLAMPAMNHQKLKTGEHQVIQER